MNRKSTLSRLLAFVIFLLILRAGEFGIDYFWGDADGAITTPGVSTILHVGYYFGAMVTFIIIAFKILHVLFKATASHEASSSTVIKSQSVPCNLPSKERLRSRVFIEIIFGIAILCWSCFSYTGLVLDITHHYLPVWSDEFFYYVNTLSFIENNTVQAALTFNGKGSLLLGADAHGFGYPVFHGLLAKVFGWSNLNLVYTNFVFIFIALLIVWTLTRVTITQKIWISNCILLFPFTPFYALTYMQEMMHVFFAVTLSFLIYHISIGGHRKKYVFLFIATIFIAGLFRPLWYFWLIGLCPFHKNDKQLSGSITLLFTGIGASFLVTLLFIEYTPNYFSSVTSLLKEKQFVDALLSLLAHFYQNLFRYFILYHNIVYNAMKYLFIFNISYFTYRAVRFKSKLSLSIASIGWSVFLLLLLLYDAYGWREIRTLAPLFYLTSFFIVIEAQKSIKIFQLAALCILFALSQSHSRQLVAERNNHNISMFEKQKKIYGDISSHIDHNGVVLLDYTPKDYSLDLLSLPLYNSNRSPIRYIVPYYIVKRVNYKYILSKPNTKTTFSKLFENQHYQLMEKTIPND